ncbi:alpha-mannosidase 2C1-like [Oratosquilla oratoria]|uniref:alpha-mannosidase 2C1-like n=1 Tax=Oratosquilla oratoria TaxID=337810 RepID=UPI003F771585
MSDPGVQASLHKNAKTTIPRISNFIYSSRFKDVNLVGRLYPHSKNVELSHWALPGGEGAWQEWTFDQVITQDFTPTEIGKEFGPTWTTHWFKLTFEIPEEWKGKEVRIRWNSDSESTVWSHDGKVLQGLSTGDGAQRRGDYLLTSSYEGNKGKQVFYIEMAANKLFGGADGDNTNPPNPDKMFTLSKAEIAVMDKLVYKLTRDLEMLYQISEALEKDPLGHQAMYTANHMVNLIIKGDDSGASAVADTFWSKGNGERAHKIAAIGNCHIDSAWLWPYSETKRKAARSYSAQLKLMEDYPEHIFVASQAQQWAWVKEYYPELFERIKHKVAEGKFLPVGTTWTEMDGNIPSGESFIRQFVYGQKFYQKELGYTCKEFWLPDTFGYSAQIPALMQHVGLTRFLTQKMSWSMVNKFPHNNFTWEGIDGSSVLAHFPPGDSYNMFFNVDELLRTVKNMKDKGRVSTSAFLFGYGDGGGGPTQNMLERFRRLKDVDGLPKVNMVTPNEMFEQLETEQHNMCHWAGELYLELHNGTYTSQAAMKQLCRSAEFRLRDAEFVLAGAVATLGSAASSLLQTSLASLDPAWKKVLLNQFHDVLPGSSIGIVYPQAEALYREALEAADSVWDESIKALLGTYVSETGSEKAVEGEVLFNSLQWPRLEVIKVPGKDGKTEEEMLVEAPPFGFGVINSVEPTHKVTVEESDDMFILDNGLIKAKITKSGLVASLVVIGDERDIFRKEDGTQLYGNQMTIYDDEPLYWDAWDVMDYHLETPRVLNDKVDSTITPVTVVKDTGLVARLRYKIAISDDSSITQDIELTAESPYLTFHTSVSWYESHKILKTVMETNILTRNASYEIQFGILERPTHMNTSWDSARYEVCGHKWADLSEPDWGLAVLNDSKYGWMGRGNKLSLSLLRSPKAPDAECDMRDHTFKYALLPHLDTLQKAGVVQRGYEFNNALRIARVPEAQVKVRSLISVEGDGIVLHTVKPTDDASGDLLLRVFECHGCKSKARLNLEMMASGVFASNGMEDKDKAIPFTANSNHTHFDISLTPFAIRAYRISFLQE